MTSQRDLVWQDIDATYRSSIAHRYARYALGLNYGALPPEVVHQAKRCLLDALACCIGGYQAPGRPMCEAVAQELGGPEEATVIGSGIRTSAHNAALVNGFTHRFLDYNDNDGVVVPAILAVSERERSSGRDFLTSLVIAYELAGRVKTGAHAVGGFASDIKGGFCMPPAMGKLMRLNEDQIANAIGTCACGSLPLFILDADNEEFNMRKNLRFAWVACDAILSCMLAKKGFTGPVRIAEGDCGWNEVLSLGKMDFEAMLDFNGWRILRTAHKGLCACYNQHGHIYATLAIVKDHDLKPQDIASVRITAGTGHNSTLAKKYPRNAETADHSAFYNNAIAIIEREVRSNSAEPRKFDDPVVLDLIEKIAVEVDSSLNTQAGISEIITKDGRRFRKRIDVPHGRGDDPLTDNEIEDKFKELASKYMRDTQVNHIIETIWNVDMLKDFGELMALTVIKSD